MKRMHAAWLAALALVFVGAAGCSNTMQGVKQDTERATERTAGAVETADVKSALIKDGRVDASKINVDTITSTKTVVLKGTVPTAEQKALAETIAREHATGYKIDNQLTVAPSARS